MGNRDRSILLIEDNADDEELTLMTLESAGIRNSIHVARDGAEALAHLFGVDGEPPRSELPMLVILDLKLPKVDGFEILERIRAEPATRTLPVVILTSSDTDEDVARGYALGVNSYVRKPVEFAEFSEAVRNLGLYWVLLNEPGGQR